MKASEIFEKLHQVRLIFTVTSGRSGTKLLTALARTIPEIKAVHEGRPRMNYVLRGIIHFPEAAKFWLESEMYPAIATGLERPVYFETSHLFCKGFIEPTLELGLRPSFVILRRPASQVAASLYSIDCIPERTGNGKLVLLGPSDPGVWAIPDWQCLSDYQLCYWYAREIERRQEYYARWLPENGCKCLCLSLENLTVSSRFIEIARFLTGKTEPIFDLEEANSILQENQNPQSDLTPKLRKHIHLSDREEEEAAVDELLAQNPFR